jgi:hypothetical protein
MTRRPNGAKGLTPEECSYVVLARSLPPDMRAQFIRAAEDIAAGREPTPYRMGGAA